MWGFGPDVVREVGGEEGVGKKFVVRRGGAGWGEEMAEEGEPEVGAFGGGDGGGLGSDPLAEGSQEVVPGVGEERTGEVGERGGVDNQAALL